MAEINVTPFVDVVLVLLIIFMVTAPFLQGGLEIDLPRVATRGLDVREGLIVSVRADRTVAVGNTVVPAVALRGRPGPRRGGPAAGVPQGGPGRALRHHRAS